MKTKPLISMETKPLLVNKTMKMAVLNCSLPLLKPLYMQASFRFTRKLITMLYIQSVKRCTAAMVFHLLRDKAQKNHVATS